MNDHYSRPIPRLRHVQPGQSVALVQTQTNQQRPEPIRVLISKDAKYGYFDGAKVCLGHPVEHCFMVFGEGGWRVKP